jgi:biopolymer transport protein ExbD
MMGLRRRRKDPDLVKPQMTALVDVLTVLVFFLLKNFSTDGEIVTQTQGMELPMSSAQARMEQTLTIAISRKHILVEGAPVALVAEEWERGGTDIPSLSRLLEERRKQTEQIAEYDKNVNFDGKLTIQGDKQIPYWLLQKVLSTCGENGFSSFSLAVMKRDAE